jgi:membrane protein YqaA with SNARE-associated domain
MRLFSAMYDRVMRWSRHPRASWYLGGLSFAESFLLLR